MADKKFQDSMLKFMTEMKSENKANSDKQAERDLQLAKSLRKMEEAQSELRRDLMHTVQEATAASAAEFKKTDEKINELSIMFEDMVKRVNKLEEDKCQDDPEGDLPVG